MLRLIFLLAFFFSFSNIYSQGNIDKGNECFEKKNYQCVIDNYIIALDQKTYKESSRYVVEYRIGNCYRNLKQFDKAIDFYKKSIATNSSQVSSFWDMADIYYDNGDFKNALTNYKAALSNSTEPGNKSEINWWIANTYFKLKEHDLAITEFKKYIDSTNYIKATGYVADEYYLLKKYDSAINYYKIYLTRLPKNDSLIKIINCFIGKSYRQLNMPDEAMKYQDVAIALNPVYTEARWEKGILYANKKDYVKAVEQYKKAFENLRPDSVEHYILAGNILNCYQLSNNYADAVVWQQKRMAYSKNRYTEYAKIAQLQYGKLKQIKEAEKTCKEAITNYALESSALKSSASSYYVKLNNIAGVIALEKKDTLTALENFERSLALDRDNFEANAGAAEIAWARGKADDYKKYFSNILKSDYDTLISSPKIIANVYGRAAYIDATNNKQPSYYKYNVTQALYFDSLQKETLLLWPRVLLNDSYSLSSKRKACLNLLERGIKYYAAEPVFVSNLYNAKAVMLETTDTAAVGIALETAVKIAPENIEPWDNLLKYYGSYNNAKGSVMVEKLITVLKKKKDAVSTSAAYVYKGDFLWRTDKKEDAKKAWQEALVWDANNATAKERAKM
ncbi:MAG: tetratricopeptide repeat protein [Ferruginibacter sp.]